MDPISIRAMCLDIANEHEHVDIPELLTVATELVDWIYDIDEDGEDEITFTFTPLKVV